MRKRLRILRPSEATLLVLLTIVLALALPGCESLFCRVGKGHHTEIEGPVRESWVNLYGGDDSDIASQLVVDNSGNVYVSGTTATIKYNSEGKKLWAFGSGAYMAVDGKDNLYAAIGSGAYITVDPRGNRYATGCSEDSYVTKKYDSDGHIVSVMRYAGPAGFRSCISAVAVDGSDYVYVTGFTCEDNSCGRNNRSYATVKYDSEGNQLWVARYSSLSKGLGYPKSIAVDSYGNVYIAGSSYSEGGAEYCTTIKYDSKGNQLWVALFNSPGASTNHLNAMVLDDSGNIYIAGSGAYKGSDFDCTTVKYDSNGNQLWAARYNGPASKADEANAIAVDSSGNVYVTGYSSGNYTVGRSYANNTVTDIYGGSDYATIKYDRDGNELWVARYNGLAAPYSARPRAMAIDYSGNVYVTGYSDGNGTQNDIATLKYDTNGNQVWVARYNGELNYDDEPYAIALDAQGNVYVAGSTTTRICGAILDERYYEDYVVIKYSQ